MGVTVFNNKFQIFLYSEFFMYLSTQYLLRRFEMIDFDVCCIFYSFFPCSLTVVHFKYFLEACSLSKICKVVLKYTLKCSQLISSSDNKNILLTTRNVRLDSGRYATKYYFIAQFFFLFIRDELLQICVAFLENLNFNKNHYHMYMFPHCVFGILL